MASFSWLARGLAARTSREGPAKARIEPRRPEGGGVSGVAEAIPSPLVGKGPVRPAAGEGRGVAPGAPQKEPSVGGIPDNETIELSLGSVLECIPLLFLAGDAEKLVASPEAQSRTVRLPLQRLLAQLPAGRIEFRFADLKPQIPDEFLGEEASEWERGEVPILLDLAEIVKRLPSATLARRGDQLEVPRALEQGLPDLVVCPEKRPMEAPLRETARLAMAASSMPILPGSLLGPETARSAPAAPAGNVPQESGGSRKEVLLPGAVPEAGPGAEPVSPAQPLFVRKTAPKPVLKLQIREPAGPKGDEVGKALALRRMGLAPSAEPASAPAREVPTVEKRPHEAGGPSEGQQDLRAQFGLKAKVEPLFSAPGEKGKTAGAKPVSEETGKATGAKAGSGGLGAVGASAQGVLASPGPPVAMRLRSVPRARSGQVPSLLERAPVAGADQAPKVASERTRAAKGLARWLGVGPGRDILIREIPAILTRLPGVSGAIISDSEALTVARQLPAGIPEEAISSSASLLYKRLRHAAGELGGGFTNQTLVGLGQWTLVITCEPPFFLTTVHSSHVVSPRLARRMRKVARALARLEAARPVG